MDKRKANHHDSDTKSDGTVEDGSDEDNDPEEEAIWKVRLTGSVKPVLLIEPIQAMKASLPKAEEDEYDEYDEDVDDEDDVNDEDDSRANHSIRDSESDEHASSDTDTEEDEKASSDDEDGININWEFDGVGFSDVDGSVNPDPLRTPVETYNV